MSTNPLTARDKLNAKWIVMIGAAVALLGILLSMSSHFVYAYFFPGSDDPTSVYPSAPTLSIVTFFCGWYDILGDYSNFDLYPLRDILSDCLDMLPSLVCLVPLVAAVLLLIVYAFSGHKMKRGSVLLLLIMTGLAIFGGLSFVVLSVDFVRYSLPDLAYNETFKSLFAGFDGNPLMVLSNLLIFVWTLFSDTKGILQNGLLAVLFTAAAISWLVNPKVGKAVSIVATVSAVLLELLFSGIYYAEFVASMIDHFFLHTGYLMTMIHDVSVLLLYGALLILLIFNRFPPIFEKKVPAVEETAEDTATEDDQAVSDVAEDIAEETTEETTEEPAEEIATDDMIAQTPAPNNNKDDAMFKLFELRADGEISPEEYRKLRDMVNEKNP